MPAASLPARAAREAFAARLRAIREEAGLTGRELATAAGWHGSKVSKIEHSVRAPSVQDVQTWVAHCGASDQLPDLLVVLRTMEGMYVEFRGRERAGFRRIQVDGSQLYERTRHFRIYEPGVVPGLFQTADYAEARLRRIAEVRGVPDDIVDAVRVRLARQRVLNSDRLFAVVLEEWALYSRIGSPEMMAAQLAHLITVCVSRPNVSLGIVPMETDRSMWSSPGFWMFDDEQVNIETPTAELTIRQPREVQMYARVFAAMSDMAVVGPPARALIMNAINRLDV